MQIDKSATVLVAGGSGLIGSSLISELKKSGYRNVISPSREELNYLSQKEVDSFFTQNKPTYVFFTAAKMGGIYANATYGADFILENSLMTSIILNAAFKYNVSKLAYFGCSSVYPAKIDEKINEDQILTGRFEPTNLPFALAKTLGITMCESFNYQYGTSFIPMIITNTYGPNQKYEKLNSPVIPSLVRKIHEAKLEGDKNLTLWGTGEQVRDFMYVNDVARAVIQVFENYLGNDAINIGTGVEISIKELALLIAEEVGFLGEINFDNKSLSGMNRKILSLKKLNELGFEHSVSLREGIKETYKHFLELENLNKLDG